MRILHVVPVNSERQIPIFLRHQIESLNDHGVHSEIIGFSGNKIKIASPLSSLTRILQLAKVVRHAKVDIVHAHWGSVLGFIVSMSHKSSVPFLLTLRGSDVNRVKTEHSLKYRIRRIFTRLAEKRADFVIYVSEKLRVLDSSTTIKYRVIPDGTPINIFTPLPKVQARLLLGWNQALKYVVFHCGDRPQEKNLQLANQVIELLRQKIDGLQFIVVQSNLTQKELATTYSAADLLLFTSHAEGSPNTVREAIACGCPVISVDVGDVKKWIQMSGAGAVCEYDIAQLSRQAYASLLSDTRADSQIAHNYSVKSVAVELIKVYQLLR